MKKINYELVFLKETLDFLTNEQGGEQNAR